MFPMREVEMICNDVIRAARFDRELREERRQVEQWLAQRHAMAVLEAQCGRKAGAP